MNAHSTTADARAWRPSVGTSPPVPASVDRLTASLERILLERRLHQATLADLQAAIDADGVDYLGLPEDDTSWAREIHQGQFEEEGPEELEERCPCSTSPCGLCSGTGWRPVPR